MTWGMVAVAGASLVGGAMSANAASSAADAQVGAANSATQSQRDMFNQQVQMEAPFRQAGVDATNKLSYLLGTSPNGYSAAPQETQAQIRARLAPQFTSSQQSGQNVGHWYEDYADGNHTSIWMPGDGSTEPQAGGPVGQPGSFWHGTGATGGAAQSGGIDQTGLDAAVQAELAKQSQGQVSPEQAAADPNYGSLLKPFGMSDFHLDPGIQFQTQQGNLALQNSQSAKNGVLSGAALKDLIGYNQGMAGTGYQSAFDRYMANKGFTFNSLSDMATRGQGAASNQATGGSSYAQGIAGTMTGAGNAAASGMVGQANALSGGISGASGAYFLRNLMNPGGGAGGVPANPFAAGPGVISDTLNIPVA